MMDSDEFEHGGQEAAPIDMLAAYFEAHGWTYEVVDDSDDDDVADEVVDDSDDDDVIDDGPIEASFEDAFKNELEAVHGDLGVAVPAGRGGGGGGGRGGGGGGGGRRRRGR